MPDRERKRPAKASMPWRGVPWAGEKGNSPPHGHTMRERPGAPLWPKGRPCADGSKREESRKTRSPPSFRRGKTRPAALTQPAICVPTGKTRRGHAGRVADAGSKDATAALTIAPPRPCVPTLGATFTRSCAMRPGRHPVMGCRPGCRAECDFAGRGPSPPAPAYASPKTRLAAPKGRRQGELHVARCFLRGRGPFPRRPTVCVPTI